MKPYYEQDGITIFNADSRAVIPLLSGVGLVMADPPYGVSGVLNTRTAIRRDGRKNDYADFDDSIGYVADVAVPIVEMCIERGWNVVLTPGNRCVTLYPPPDSFGAIIQPASVGLQPWGRADAQPILYYGKSPNGGQGLASTRCSYTVTETAEANGHPCPKPIKFWRTLMAASSRASDLILDPFMGSGTTLRAAKDLGRRAIGIELNERYCEIAVERLRQGVLL